VDLTDRWPTLGDLCCCATVFPAVEVWAFGSMLRTEEPNDLDILVLYDDPDNVVALRASGLWEVNVPPVDIIAMTRDEEHHYRFIETTGAIRLHS
jgi:predicted nucleotidyltransferase